MSGPDPGTRVSSRPIEDRLESWKEIATYLKRDVTTVQRWEKREGMPVYRHLHDRMGSVSASRAELEAWTRSRTQTSAEEAVGGRPPELSAVAALAHRLEDRMRWGWVASLVATGILLLGVVIWFRETEVFWRSPIAHARFQTMTDFGGITEAAAVSRDGRLVAFLSDRDGPMDVWVTQVGSGEYHNLTGGRVAELVNPSIRSPSFSPDGALVSFWIRKPVDGEGGETSTWAVPTLGGQPRPYLDGIAEFDWSRDGAHLAFHTSASGDPLYVAKDGRMLDAKLLFKAATGLHSHFPLWSPDGSYLYFVHGSIPDKLDIWRVPRVGGRPERITDQETALMYPVLLDDRTLLYLAADGDGNGPWLYSMDVMRRIPHRLSSGPERYTSLAGSADGHHLALTLANPRKTLWRLDLRDAMATQPTPVALSTGTGYSPRMGPKYLLYVSMAGAGEGIWKLADGTGTELWHAAGARILGAPAISPDGQLIAFSVHVGERSLLTLMQADGTSAHVLCDALDLEGAPAWSPDGRYLTTAVKEHGTPHVVRVPVGGCTPKVLVSGYSLDPAWSPDGSSVLYSGPDVGTKFVVRLFPTGATAPSGFALTLTRGTRHVAFLPGGRSVVSLQGDIPHKNLWQMDLQTGAERPLTNLPPGFDVRDFDLSPDGREVVFERVQERSEVVLLDVP